MILASALLAVALLDKPEILAVRCEPTARGVVVRILANGTLDAVTTERTGGDLLFGIPARLPAHGLPLPAPVAPLRSLAFEATSARVELRLGVEPGTMLVTQTQGSLLSLIFSTDGDQSVDQDVEALYPLLFSGARSPQEGAPQSELDAAPASGRSGWWGLGFVSIKPGLVVRYVDAYSTFLDTPLPLRVRYWEVQPSLHLRINPDVSLFGGRLTLSYEPRFRRGKHGIPVLNRPSHFFSAGLELPVGSSLSLSLGDQYSRGAIETRVLDPGREYFYDLGPFVRNEVSFGLRTETPGPLDLSLGGWIAKETVEPGTGYFGNERRTGYVGLRYELSSARTLTLGYSLEHVPAPESRPVAETRAQGLGLGIEGELAPLLQANVALGYRWQENPRAPAGGDRFRGVTFGGSLRRELTNGATIALGGSRSTQLSAFESNAFYVANGLQATLTLPLPMNMQLIGGPSYQRNGYRLAAGQLGIPRQDRLWAWTAGIGRPLKWSFLRADYSWESRTSNVPGLSTRTHSLVVQLGLGAGGR